MDSIQPSYIDLGNAESLNDVQQETTPNKYKYKPFEGLAGERLLKEILRKILPLALFETWQVLAAENQAPGNDAFLGITKLAEYRQRSMRKMRMDLDEFAGRQLLRIRVEWKVFQRPDGTMQARPVAVKDFEQLYDLAYEYMLWQDSEWYVPPDREYAELIRQSEPLMKKLMRFDNYRRIICHRKPGPQATEKEIYQWYTSYDGSTPLPDIIAKEAKVAVGNTTEPKVKEYLKEELKEDLKKDSEERKESSGNTEVQDRDMNTRSGVAAGLGVEGGMAIRNGSTVGMERTNPQPNGQSKTKAKTPTPPVEEGSAARAKEVIELKQSKRKKHGKDEVPPPLPTYLQEVLKPLIQRFCDQASKSTETSFAWIYDEMRQRGFDEYSEEFLELVTEARDLTIAKASHGLIRGRNRDGSIAQMPYFLTILERNVDAWCKRYDEAVQEAQDDPNGCPGKESLPCSDEAEPQQAAVADRDTQEIGHRDAGDDKVVQLHPTVSAQQEEPGGQEPDHQELVTEVGPPQLPAVAPVMAEEQAPTVAAGDDEPVAEPAGEYIDVDDSTLGWSSPENPEYYGRELRDRWGKETYQYRVLPTRKGRYGIVIFARQHPAEERIYLTHGEVREALRQR